MLIGVVLKWKTN